MQLKTHGSTLQHLQAELWLGTSQAPLMAKCLDLCFLLGDIMQHSRVPIAAQTAHQVQRRDGHFLELCPTTLL